MAEAVWMAYKTTGGQGGQSYIDDIIMVLVNADDGQTEAQVKTTADGLLETAGYDLPNTYFDSAVNISDLTSGPLKDAGDHYIVRLRSIVKVEG